MHCLRVLFLFLFLVLITPLPLLADIRLNEILIDPQQSVELINTASEEADLSNWYIDDSGGTTFFTIPQQTRLSGSACIVFSADFNFNKSSADTVRLFNSAGTPVSATNQLIDSYSYKTSPGPDRSFIRIPDGIGDWTSASASLGKQNNTLENCVRVPTPTQIPDLPKPTALPSLSDQIDGVRINEVMSQPAEGEYEWVELYNANSFSVSLDNWYIDDKEDEGSSPKSFTVTIPSSGFAVIELKTALLNNSSDTVRLLDATQAEKDRIDYGESEKNRSFGYAENDFCLMMPSKGTSNEPCFVRTESISSTPLPSRTSSPTRSPTNTKSASVLGITAGRKTLSYPTTIPVRDMKQKTAPDLKKTFLIGGTVTLVLSAASILLKIKFRH